ncbi:protein-methionine-sulfoxide reductase heme-binding subunit MsrQ [Photobacterium aquae]|uniref:protein-methionine-sulfoxide reductase heme-binding subunit MsrQ n=1 Tax=Photobacterium aquae TaxID=1195763 RepID=UPI000A07B8C9
MHDINTNKTGHVSRPHPKRRILTLKPIHIRAIKALIHLVSLWFAALLIWNTLEGNFGADPIQGLSHFTGLAALNTLFITLAVSPFARWLKQGQLVKVRRVLGLYSFAWAVLHLAVYIALDLNFQWTLIADEIVSRPYLSLGAVCWLVLFALAITSSHKIQRTMGRYWQQLHNWVYLALILAPIHYLWSVKSGLIEPVIYLVVSIALLAMRYHTFRRWFAQFATAHPRS